MLIVFWDINGPLLVHFQEKVQNVTSAQYSDMLVNELKPATRSKHLGLFSKRVLLRHNIRTHTAAHTVDTQRAQKFGVLKHPPYGPDLAPSDFHFSGPIKEHLQGQKFADDEVMEAVQCWLKAIPKTFFIEGIRKLVDRWT
jgi:histone-lysine N-methyltransferase SETMAR